MSNNIQNISVPDYSEQHLLDEIERLRTENTELAQFSHILSHDLRAPLKNINNLALMISIDPNSDLSERSRSNIDKLKGQTENLHRLIHDLREISKQNLNNLAMEWVDPNIILDHVIDQYEDQFTESEVKFARKPMPNLFANPQLIWQLFDNLVRNALKHGARPLQISAEGDAQSDQTVLTFKNNLVEQTQKNQSNFTFSTACKSSDSGTGIGLFICAKIAKIHNAEICASGESGEFIFAISFKETNNA